MTEADGQASPAMPRPRQAGEPVFELAWPERLAAPILFNSPHSGDDFPASFLAQTRLGLRDLRRSADLFMADLAGGAVGAGLPLMQVRLPRSVLDMNREADELDPAMFDAPLTLPVNHRSIRVRNGYGVIPRLVAETMAIYPSRLPETIAVARLRDAHMPYHAELDRILSALAAPFGWSLVVDCHSMPSATPMPGTRLADVVLGDRNGTSCAPVIIDYAEKLFIDLGLTVTRNQPYAGGYITTRHGRPWDGRHALQIEINRALYMDEATYRPHRGYDRIRHVMDRLAAALVALAPAIDTSFSRAAE